MIQNSRNRPKNCFVDRFNDEEGSDKFGAHMIFHNIEYAKIEYMEIHNCGQLAELGRYPIHFHNSYDQESVFRLVVNSPNLCNT